MKSNNNGKKNGSKIMFMFPGQGSQYINMGKDFLDNNKSYKKYFDISSSIIGENILDIIYDRNGKGILLNNTEYSQIAIYTLSSAINDYIIKNILPDKNLIDTIIGHSLGEYSSLYATGFYGYQDGAKLVAYRGKIMSDAGKDNEGMMAAIIGSNKKEVNLVLNNYNDKVFIANYNDYFQMVISGYKKDVQKAMADLKKKGAKKVIPLKVSIASHCPLMREASYKLEKFMDSNIKFKNPDINFFSATTLSYVKKEDIKKTLVEQLTHPIRWVSSIEYLLGKDIKIFIEIGPGKVLSNLVKKIAAKNKKDNIIVISTDSLDDIENFKMLLGKEVIRDEA